MGSAGVSRIVKGEVPWIHEAAMSGSGRNWLQAVCHLNRRVAGNGGRGVDNFPDLFLNAVAQHVLHNIGECRVERSRVVPHRDHV